MSIWWAWRGPGSGLAKLKQVGRIPSTTDRVRAALVLRLLLLLISVLLHSISTFTLISSAQQTVGIPITTPKRDTERFKVPSTNSVESPELSSPTGWIAPTTNNSVQQILLTNPYFIPAMPPPSQQETPLVAVVGGYGPGSYGGQFPPAGRSDVPYATFGYPVVWNGAKKQTQISHYLPELWRLKPTAPTDKKIIPKEPQDRGRRLFHPRRMRSTTNVTSSRISHRGKMRRLQHYVDPKAIRRQESTREEQPA